MKVEERWRQYVKETEQFALYPEAGTASDLALAYVALGLVEEWQELLNDNILLELGDVLWYLAAFQRELAPYLPPGVEQQEISRAEVAGKVKKLIRGDKDRAQALRDLAAMTYITDPLLELDYFANEEGLIRAMDMNVAKLTDRMARGVIKGSGDHR
jgi:hypothetical protein